MYYAEVVLVVGCFLRFDDGRRNAAVTALSVAYSRTDSVIVYILHGIPLLASLTVIPPYQNPLVLDFETFFNDLIAIGFI